LLAAGGPGSVGPAHVPLPRQPRCLQFEPARQLQLTGLNHMDLLSRTEVLSALLRWLR
jgi:hypothetical protein